MGNDEFENSEDKPVNDQYNFHELLRGVESNFADNMYMYIFFNTFRNDVNYTLFEHLSDE